MRDGDAIVRFAAQWRPDVVVNCAYVQAGPDLARVTAKVDHVLAGANLVAHLDADIVLAGCFDEELALARVVAAGFFDVDVLAGFARHDRCRRMPVVRCCDYDRIDRFIVQNSSQVACRLLRPSLSLQVTGTSFLRITSPGNSRYPIKASAEIL